MTPEQMQKIVDEAPIGATHANTNSYFKENDYGVWSVWDGYWNSAFRWPEGEMFSLINLRSALSQHDTLALEPADIPHGTIVLEK